MCKKYGGAISTHDAVIISVRNAFIGRYVVEHGKLYYILSKAYRTNQLLLTIGGTRGRVD